ncbi:hypothetical protein Bbelb_010430 [Branchiostoma belcheri]|nr:hypothetical protein Bbelb_010430 [Branchiostoma belcheri]
MKTSSSSSKGCRPLTVQTLSDKKNAPCGRIWTEHPRELQWPENHQASMGYKLSAQRAFVVAVPRMFVEEDTIYGTPRQDVMDGCAAASPTVVSCTALQLYEGNTHFFQVTIDVRLSLMVLG